MQNSYIKSYRSIEQNIIWQTKPAWWYKVWVYILNNVNYKDNGKFKRGSGFFERKQIYINCYLKNDIKNPKSIDNVIRGLKTATQITTQKTTRGMIITVVNYDKYQSVDNFKNDTENDAGNDIRTTQERHRNDTIHEESNKEIKKEYIEDVNILWITFRSKINNRLKLDEWMITMRELIGAGRLLNMKSDQEIFIKRDFDKLYSQYIKGKYEINLNSIDHPALKKLVNC